MNDPQLKALMILLTLAAFISLALLVDYLIRRARYKRQLKNSKIINFNNLK